jgi:membrane protease YdiL (CAAX protease family)
MLPIFITNYITIYTKNILIRKKSCKFTALFQNGMIHEQRFNPLSQLALLFVFCMAGFVATGLLGLLVGNVMHVDSAKLADELMKPENVSWNRLLQVLGSFMIMALPAFLVATFNGGNPVQKIGFNEAISGRQTLIVVFMVIAGFMVSGALGELNEMIPLPKSTEIYFKQLEDNYNKEVLSITSMKSNFDYIVSLLVLALIPAIFEEMLFRGCLQKIMISLFRNAFAGILITSIIFSAIHFSYYGFLPRLFLGLMLGYIFHFSKNIWLNIIAHFLNNAYPLTAMYALTKQGRPIEDVLQETYPLYYGVIGAVILILLFLAFKRESERILSYSNANDTNRL